MLGGARSGRRGGATASCTRSIRARSRTPTATGSATCAGSSPGSTTSSGSAIDGIWLNPTMPSPNDDWGYDVADFTAVHPDLGTLEDLDALIAEAGRRGIARAARPRPQPHERPPRVVPGRAGRPRRALPRLLRVGRPQARRRAAQQLGSSFGGPAWTLDEASGQYYLHNFLPTQPDLNWWNEEVRDAFDDILRFWFDARDRRLPHRRDARHRQRPRAARRARRDRGRPPARAQARLQAAVRR